MDRIPCNHSQIEEADIAAVAEALRRGDGKETVAAFERALTSRYAPHAVAVSSLGAGLQLACLALDMGPRDRIWVSPIASEKAAAAALLTGAAIDIVDADPLTGLM